MADGTDILIVGCNWVGDMVMTEPLVAALKRRWPDRAIDILAPPGVLDVARRMQGVRAGIPLPFSPHVFHPVRRYVLGRALRGRYSDAYVLPGSFVSSLAPAFAGIANRHGYLREPRYPLINRVVRVPRGARRQIVAAHMRLVGESATPHPRLMVDLDKQAELLRRFGLEGGTFAALVPGTAGGPAKRWPVPAYGALARRLQARGTPVVLFGGPNDTDLNAAVSAMAPATIDIGGKTSLSEAIDLMAAAQVAVANDSGLMHVAAAVGVPTVGIFGSTSPDNTPPMSDAAAVVTHRLACSPCHARTCPLEHTRCLTEIEPAEVLATLDRLLVSLRAQPA